MRRRKGSATPAERSRGDSTPSQKTKTAKTLLHGDKTRAFLFATAAFVFVLITVHVCKVGAPTVVAPISEDDLALLRHATEGVRRNATVSGFAELVDLSTHVACAAELMLEQLVAADEAEEMAAAARLTQGRFSKAAALPQRQRTSVLRAYEQQLGGMHDVLAGAADVSYGRLRGMLRNESTRVLPKAVSSLPRTVFGWVASTVHMYGAVLPEYSLRKDDTEAHAKALLRSVALLSWVARHPHLFTWAGSPCHKSLVGVTKPWLRFCDSSLATVGDTATRRAASFEELIALYPQFAPFRLHHAVLLTIRNAPLATTSSALRLIRGQAEKLHTYDHVDRMHKPVLTLLAAFVTPMEQVDKATRESVRTILASTMRTCKAFLGDATQMDVTWPSPFTDEIRPPLFDEKQLGALLAKLRLLGDDMPQRPLEGDCLVE